MTAAALLLAAVYANPVLHADFSDPDVCIGGDGRAYLTASSFGGLPGLPVLASDDLVNWSYVAYALAEHPFADAERETPGHGNAVWAPSIRYRADRREYVIYWGDPDRGVYRVAAPSPAGPWGRPRLVVAGRGLIDPCPLYDDDGRVYLVNAYAASRAGLNSVLTVRELDADESRAIADPVMVYDGIPAGNFTAEGPKFYKKDGEYWLFFPAGGVEQGWQVAARSGSVYGPYAARTVLAQGETAVNGPHQGAAVLLPGPSGAAGSWHFVHFQDRGPYGRIVHLQPMEWAPGAWPEIGDRGRPVASAPFPGGRDGVQLPFGGLAVGDEFDALRPGLQWQFLGRSGDLAAWATPHGRWRLYSTAVRPAVGGADNLWATPNLMVQKFPAARFTATLKAEIGAKEPGSEAGLIVQGRDYARIGLALDRSGDCFDVVYTVCTGADRGAGETPRKLGRLPARTVPSGLKATRTAGVFLRVGVEPVADGSGTVRPQCVFSWSADGERWQSAPESFTAANGKWIGATFGLFAIHAPAVANRGWIDADWLRVE